MKIIKTLLIIISLSFSSAYAEIYKCGILDVVVAYQEDSCQLSGLDRQKFSLKTDISVKVQRAAAKKYKEEQKIRSNNKILAQEYALRERLIRAEEAKAYAQLLDANAHERRVDVLAKNNFSTRLRRIRPLRKPGSLDPLVRLVPVLRDNYYYSKD